MAAGDYVVTAPVVVARDGTPYGESYYYRGAVLPAGVPAEEKERLAAAELVKVEGGDDPAPKTRRRAAAGDAD
ncbi:hypothetical protein FDO65_10085 [Nakamurella flava]|uniref:Uncharacterized protein n=1 Tax=Nakamurella flava TaxID=2576308 RepID=A0A4U6QMP2_9ACTN|nr:hypothetical protein [Nakamurella flava]TKV61863.1 hypothetical protein FDO65_10085 [Nakamurella flava]